MAGLQAWAITGCWHSLQSQCLQQQETAFISSLFNYPLSNSLDPYLGAVETPRCPIVACTKGQAIIARGVAGCGLYPVSLSPMMSPVDKGLLEQGTCLLMKQCFMGQFFTLMKYLHVQVFLLKSWLCKQEIILSVTA